MKRRNAIVRKDFYEQNEFCEHITLEDGEKMNRIMKPYMKDNQFHLKWICELCENKNITTLKNDDKGKKIDDVDI